MEEVAQLCDRTIFLKGGKIIANDLPKNLAKTISACRLHLTIADGLKKTISLAEARRFPHQTTLRSIQITLDETEIPSFLTAVALAGVEYTAIKIEEPTLEDYFLHIAGRDS